MTLDDGSTVQTKVDAPLGRTVDSAIPVEALDAKFLDCASRVLGASGADRVRRRIWAIDRVDTVRELTDAIEASGSETTMRVEVVRAAETV
ncbi:MAG: hypothetical protein ACXWIM_23420 [Burkholderiales bacterium]